MSEVVIYDQIRGEELVRFLARKNVVQRRLKWEAAEIAVRAESHLNAARHRTGQSQIVVERGDYTDWYVVLDDEHAMQIEFGHAFKNAETEAGAKPKRARAVAPLRKAVGWVGS